MNILAFDVESNFRLCAPNKAIQLDAYGTADF